MCHTESSRIRWQPGIGKSLADAANLSIEWIIVATRSTLLFVTLRRSPLEHRAALEAAHRLGYDVIVLAESVPPGLPEGIVRAVHAVDLHDTEAVDRAVDATTAPIAGCVAWSDGGVEPASRIAARLGLPGITPAAARLARNKYLMRRALAGRANLIPRFARVTTWADTESAQAEVGCPGVLKPAAGSGSKGIFLITDPAQLRFAFDELGRITGADRIFAADRGELLYEELLAGTEHSVEGFVHDGEVCIAGVTDKRTSEPYRLEVGHAYPSALPDQVLARIHELTCEVVRTLGFDHCAFHLECMVGPHGVKLIEVAARGGGDFIGSHLVTLSGRGSYAENTIRVATGRRPVFADTPAFYSGMRKIVAQAPGRLAGISGLDQAVRVPGIQHVVIDRAPDSVVKLPPAHFSSSLIGALIATGESPLAVERSLNTAISSIRVELQANPN
jgi:biotin carboxylase